MSYCYYIPRYNFACNRDYETQSKKILGLLLMIDSNIPIMPAKTGHGGTNYALSHYRS